MVWSKIRNWVVNWVSIFCFMFGTTSTTANWITASLNKWLFWFLFIFNFQPVFISLLILSTLHIFERVLYILINSKIWNFTWIINTINNIRACSGTASKTSASWIRSHLRQSGGWIIVTSMRHVPWTIFILSWIPFMTVLILSFINMILSSNDINVQWFYLTKMSSQQCWWYINKISIFVSF